MSELYLYRVPSTIRYPGEGRTKEKNLPLLCFLPRETSENAESEIRYVRFRQDGRAETHILTEVPTHGHLCCPLRDSRTGQPLPLVAILSLLTSVLAGPRKLHTAFNMGKGKGALRLCRCLSAHRLGHVTAKWH